MVTDQQRLIGREREIRLLLAALTAGRHVLIEGPVGVGKTRLADEAAARMGRPVVRLDADERFSEEKLTGWFDPPLVIESGYTEASFQPGPLHRAMTQGAVLFVNELNRAPEGAQNVLLPALDEGFLEIPRLEQIRAAPGFVVVTSQNPREFVGAALLSEALRDRFELLQLDYQSFEEEERIVKQITGLDDDRLIRRAVFVARSTRTHPQIKRGASVRAAAGLALIASKLIETGLDDDDALAQAAELALPTRIELKNDLEKSLKDGWADLAAELFEQAKKKEPTEMSPAERSRLSNR